MFISGNAVFKWKIREVRARMHKDCISCERAFEMTGIDAFKASLGDIRPADEEKGGYKNAYNEQGAPQRQAWWAGQLSLPASIITSW
jgi:hypothetical protein